MAGTDLVLLECELNAYRKGCLKVRLNFAQGTMSWQESRQWINNFVRTLDEDQIREFKRLAERLCGDTGEQPGFPDASCLQLSGGETLQLTFCRQSGQVLLESEKIDPAVWAQLRRAIERVSRTPFRL